MFSDVNNMFNSPEQFYEINFRGGEGVRGSLGLGAPVIKLGLIVNT